MGRRIRFGKSNGNGRAFSQDEVKSKAASVLSRVFSALEARQPAYRAEGHRHFMQLPITHTLTPRDGAEIPPDRKSERIESENRSWEDSGINLDATLPCALRVDVYENAGGKGFTLTAKVEIEGKVYQRVRNFGHLSERESGWREIESRGIEI